MTSIRVYEFGLLPPTQNANIVDDQIWRAHRYRNVLVEIERQRRDTIRQAMGAHPDIAPLEAEIRALSEERDQLKAQIASKRRASRSRSDSPEERAAVRGLGARIKPLRVAVKAARKAIADDPGIRKAIEDANKHAHDRLIESRAACGVYWSTYLLQEAAADQARKEVMMPRFARWNGEGRVSVQLQGGLPLEDLWGSDTQIRILPVNVDLLGSGVRRGIRRRSSRTELHMRVGSVDRKPVWAVWPMLYHRPVPEGAIIKVATVSKRRRDATAWSWRVHITVDVSNCAARRPVPASGAVALNMGFALTPSRAIRSGYMVGDDGQEQEILLLKSDAYRGRDLTPDQRRALQDWIPQAIAKSESIRSFRDKAQDLMRSLLCAWKSGTLGVAETSGTVAAETANGAITMHRNIFTLLLGDHRVAGRSADEAVAIAHQEMSSLRRPSHSDHPHERDQRRLVSLTLAEVDTELAKPQPQFPEWFLKATESIHMWRSPGRFRHLLAQWRRIHHDADGVPMPHRFDGDQIGLWILEAWNARDIHLECYEAGLRRSALGDRREGYRIIASRMAQQYRYLVIDDTDLRVFQRSPAPESDRIEIPAVKRNQRLASCSELRSVLINAFGADRVIKYDRHNLSRQCNHCGHINDPWTPLEESSRMHTCDGCGERWDQDANFCRNLLALYRTQPDARVEPTKPAKSRRFAKANQTAEAG